LASVTTNLNPIIRTNNAILISNEISSLVASLTFILHTNNALLTLALSEPTNWFGTSIPNPKLFTRNFKQHIGSVLSIRNVNSVGFDIYQSINVFVLQIAGYSPNWEEKRRLQLTYAPQSTFTWDYSNNYLIPLSSYFLAATLIAPAIVLALKMLFLIVCKCVLVTTRLTVLYSFELVADSDPKELKPFTLLAGAADLLGLIVKFVVSIIRWIYH
jgi:hypothetical protein